MNRSPTLVRAHWRKPPVRPDKFDETHAPMFAAREIEKRIEAAIRLHFEPVVEQGIRELQAVR